MSKKPIFFAAPSEFRRWLHAHHRTATEVLVGFYKKASGRPSMTWPESVDEALCFGWIDGVRRRVDAERYMIRFTPRKAVSAWSLVNIRKAEALILAKRMKPAGLRAFEARDAKKSGIYSFEQREHARLDADAEARFKANRAAWEFFQSQPPGYRRVVTFWVMSAKREDTRARRLETLIADSAAGRRIGLLQR